MINNSKSTDDRPMPLEGIRMVEFGIFIAGPGAGAILGDLGADVLKIESWAGDPGRYLSKIGKIPPLAFKNGESIIFQTSNRNKKGICIDIAKEKGREILYRLLRDADVFITNLRKSTITKLGVDYEKISKVNPKIIYAGISGYGPEGPMSNLGAFDPLGLAYSGMMFMSGSPEPLHIPPQVALLDQATAISASHAILTALLVRERQGIGQEIHISLYSTGMWLMHFNLMAAHILSMSPSHWDRYEHTPLGNYSCCKDGKWIMGIHHPEEKYWIALCEATGQNALIDDPRFADDEQRLENCAELVTVFDKVFATKTRDEWMEILLAKGLMFVKVQDITEIQDDPQALINRYIVDFEDPRFGKVKVPGYPIHFSANRAGIRSLAPAIGEHTDFIMQQAGYTEQEIKKLKEERVVK
jgi:crotonobetainyl-CoA:carnitine CoA-transferase CaiB-like acyl-CoA transferase